MGKSSFTSYMIIFVLALFLGFYSVDYNEERAPALMLLSITFVIGFFMIRNLAYGVHRNTESNEEFAFLLRIFALSLIVRIVISFCVHYFAGYGTFAQDDQLYDRVGWTIVLKWRGDYYGDIYSDLPYYSRNVSKGGGYAYFVAFLYYIFGKAQLVPKMFNCFLGSLTVVYLTKFTWSTCGKNAAWTLGIMAALFPSMVLWSGLGIKDPIATFSIVLTIWFTYLCSKELKASYVVKMIVALLVLYQVRDYMFVLLVGSIGMSFFLKKSKNLVAGYILGFIFMVFLFYLIRYLGFGGSYIENASFEALNYYRKSSAVGNSAIHVNADISSPSAALAYLPVGVAYFLFAPFPWSIRSMRQLYALPEILVWYGVFFFFIRGIIYAFKEKFTEFAPSLTVMFLVTLTYSLVEGNLGTAYRHRGQIMGFYLMFTAIGLAHVFSNVKKSQKEKKPQTALERLRQQEFGSECS